MTTKMSYLLFSVWTCQHLVQQFSNTYYYRLHWNVHTFFQIIIFQWYFYIKYWLYIWLNLSGSWLHGRCACISLFSLETVCATKTHRRTKMFTKSSVRGVSSQRKSWGTWAARCSYHGNTEKPTDAVTKSANVFC